MVRGRRFGFGGVYERLNAWQNTPNHMSIRRDDALRIFGDTYRAPTLAIYDVNETGPGHFKYPVPPNTWYIRFSLEDRPLIGPSRLLCISKADGEIVYDGFASDEG
jgi:hypothetical protein